MDEQQSSDDAESSGGVGVEAARSMITLLAQAQAIVDNSTVLGAKDFDTVAWLRQWIELPHAALGGRRPVDLIGTPTGAEAVSRLLGAMESGAYQ